MDAGTAVVVGAGIAGLTVARELALAGWQVTVFEAAPSPREQGYMIDFFGPGYDAAEQMGILGRLRELAYDIDVVSFVDEPGRERKVDYRLVTSAQRGRFLSLMRPDLELALRERLPDGVDLRYGRSVTAITEGVGAVHVTLDDGATTTADLLIGADGIHSLVRREVFGTAPDTIRRLGFHTFAYIFDDADLHERLRTTWYLSDTMHRMIGLYGLRDGRVAIFGTHRSGDAGLPASTRDAVLAAYAGMGSLIDTALEHCPDDAGLYYDEVAQVVLPTWSSGRVCLVGDACHAVSLLAGQGASLAVAGGRLLASQLVDADSIATAFRRYRELWQPIVDEKQRAGRRAASSFVPKSWFALIGRRVGLRLLQSRVLSGLVSSRIIGKQGAALESVRGR